MRDDMPLNKIKLILFDFDGTISDSHDVALEIYNSLAVKFGFRTVVEEDLVALKSKSSKEALKYLGVSYFKLPFVLREARQKFQTRIETLEPIHGIENVLLDLKSKSYQLGILTSNSKENVSRFLQKNDLELFQFLRTGVSVFGKTRVMKNLLREAKLSPEEVIYVGDETRDIEAAKSAGIKVISVTWGFSARDILLSQKPDFVLDRPSQLSDLFSELIPLVLTD